MKTEGMKESIRKMLESQPTRQLVETYEAYDRSQWSPEAFEVMYEMLQERGERVPKPETFARASEQVRSVERTTEVVESSRGLATGIQFFAAFAFLLLAGVALFEAGGAKDGASAVLVVVSIALVCVVVFALGYIIKQLGELIDLQRKR